MRALREADPAYATGEVCRTNSDVTLHITNMAVEYGPLEDRFPLRTGGELHFREYFRECVFFWGGQL